ncbi:MAG: type II toxin-antitoxin system VapC family toxin [Gemmatimonadales bacterium]
MIVLDASAAVEYLIGERWHEAVTDRVRQAAGQVQAPEILDLEVLATLRRLVEASRTPVHQAELALKDFLQLPIRRHGHRDLAPRIWELRHNLTAYDGAYIALAEALDAPLITCDARLAAAPGHSATIEVMTT